jgi:hypothetical protein
MGVVDDFLDGINHAIDEIVEGIDETIRGISNEIATQLYNYVLWFGAQVTIDSFLSAYGLGIAGFFVDAGFLLFTFFGFYGEYENVRSAHSVVRFILAIFGLGFDIWLNLTIH